MCYQVRYITKFVKCVVTMPWVMAWLRNGFGFSMTDERTCTMRRELCVHLWWMMIWCVRSKKECVTTGVSQFLLCPCTFLGFQGLYLMTSSAVANISGGYIKWGGYTKTCAPLRYVAANMWKNSLKNVVSDKYKILYESILDSFTVKLYFLSQ